MSASSRPSKKQNYFDICDQVAKRSTCVKRQIGAIAVSPHDLILATGYNGAPRGVKHCTEQTCKRIGVPSGQFHEKCKAVHAEQNLVCQAARHGIPLFGATVYCNNRPCSICLKMLINAGVARVLYLEDYPDDLTEEILSDPNVPIEVIKTKRD